MSTATSGVSAPPQLGEAATGTANETISTQAADVPSTATATATAVAEPVDNKTDAETEVPVASQAAQSQGDGGSAQAPTHNLPETGSATKDKPKNTITPPTTSTHAEFTESPTTSLSASHAANDAAAAPLKAASRPDVDTSQPADFEGEIATNNEIPSPETIRKLDDYILVDRHGKSHTFKSLYSGRNVARRMLFIFVRHFFCGNCQEYLRSLVESISTEALLRLPVSTFITVIGCGDSGLIQMYADATNCPFPIYSDPSRGLYQQLGMTRTWELGEKPAYMKKSMLKSMGGSIVQGLKQVGTGLVTKAGDQKQVGGEFLFEPLDVATPISTPEVEQAERSLGHAMATAADDKGGKKKSSGSYHEDDDDDRESQYGTEVKRVTWCHRMRTTRDHAEIPELMEVLGLDGNGKPISDQRRWNKALQERKGTGLSMASQMSQMSIRNSSERKETKKEDEVATT